MTKMTMPYTYKDAGVDIDNIEYSIKGLIDLAQKTFKFRENKIGNVLEDIGLYANLVDIGNYALAVSTDGAGSKVLVAQELKKFDTIGIDMVAMNVNDILCVGAEPIALVDYLAMEHIDRKLIDEIAVGIFEGVKQAGVALVGGETAMLPDTIKGINGTGFDISGTAFGVVEKDKIIDGRSIKPGDVVIGFASSGVHSNGLTLARKVLPKEFWNEILIPTKIYVKEILDIIKKYNVHGLAHITGGGYRNLLRITRYGFSIKNLPEMEVFKKIQEYGGISDEEMYKTFNMGVGFCVVASRENANKILSEFDCFEIGEVIEEHKVHIKLKKKEIIL